ncbi:uncharacterized protein LOC144115102 [Amblyomma americanum]
MLLSASRCVLLVAVATAIMAENATVERNIGDRGRQCCPDFNLTFPEFDEEEEQREEVRTPPVQQRGPYYTARPAHILTVRQSNLNYLLRPYQMPYTVVFRRPALRPQRPMALTLHPQRTSANRNGTLSATPVRVGGAIGVPLYSRIPAYGAPYYRPYYHHVYRGATLAPIPAAGFVMPYPAPPQTGLQPPAHVTVPVFINVGTGGIPAEYQPDGDGASGFLAAVGVPPFKGTAPQTGGFSAKGNASVTV